MRARGVKISVIRTDIHIEIIFFALTNNLSHGMACNKLHGVFTHLYKCAID